jgi:type I restriction enzyme S subunit
MLLPSYSILQEHESITDLLFKKKKENLNQIDKLEKLRDILLPKLISGELRLPETDSIHNKTSDTDA